MTIDIKYIEVVGNAAADRFKVAQRTVEQSVPNAVVTDVTWFGRGPSGSPVFAVEYEVED